MRKYFGKGVDSIAIGKTKLFRRENTEVKRQRISDTEAELERFESAKRHALAELDEIYKKALREVGEANANIFEIHKMMLEDEDYCEAIVSMISTQKVNAEYAIAVSSDNFAAMFSSMSDSYMKARSQDVRDISNRLIRALGAGVKHEDSDGEGVIICADDLAPSETVTLNKKRVLAFVTAHGSTNSHTAILARSMNIPAIIGVGDDFLAELSDGELAIVDGLSGEVILSPDEETLRAAEAKMKEVSEGRKLLEQLRNKENITLDGRRIEIFANVGGMEDIGNVLLNDAGGIGIFRSEFLYLERDDYPTEDEQFTVYKRLLESMAGKRVIIRTLDIGADKQIDYFHLQKEENPALGLRAIRICLKRPEIFRTQLRALYRASAYGQLSIMFPMICDTSEVIKIKEICADVRAELKREGIPFCENTELGIMIETPAAALISDKLAPLVDFFSIGTNDLTQYTLACDRQNPEVDEFCNVYHEAIMRLIEYSAKCAHESRIWIGICGELAADTTLTEKFLRMGIDELSVSPSSVLRLRKKVRELDLS